MAFAIHVELVESRAQTLQVIEGQMIAAGSEDTQIENLDEIHREFIEDLERRPKVLDMDQAEIDRRIALGVSLDGP